jgi:hypothetical protein
MRAEKRAAMGLGLDGNEAALDINREGKKRAAFDRGDRRPRDDQPIIIRASYG